MKWIMGTPKNTKTKSRKIKINIIYFQVQTYGMLMMIFESNSLVITLIHKIIWTCCAEALCKRSYTRQIPLGLNKMINIKIHSMSTED